jgi:chromosome segregation ATPase
MKRMLVFLMLICFVMISGCQKQDSGVEAQLAQRKAELDAREKALDEREKAMGAWEKAITRPRAIPSDLQPRKPAVDPEQAKTEREKRIQQLPPELQALVRDRSLLDPRTAGTAGRSPGTQDRAAEQPAIDPEQAKAEREKRIQQLPPELQALIRNRSLPDPGTAGRSSGTQDRAAEFQRRLEEARKQMSGIASPTPEGADIESTSPAPSPTP